jgi:hypothetical protein
MRPSVVTARRDSGARRFPRGQPTDCSGLLVTATPQARLRTRSRGHRRRRRSSAAASRGAIGAAGASGRRLPGGTREHVALREPLCREHVRSGARKRCLAPWFSPLLVPPVPRSSCSPLPGCLGRAQRPRSRCRWRDRSTAEVRRFASSERREPAPSATPWRPQTRGPSALSSRLPSTDAWRGARLLAGTSACRHLCWSSPGQGRGEQLEAGRNDRWCSGVRRICLQEAT